MVSKVLNMFNNLEEVINRVITDYFAPKKNSNQFHTVLLNSSVTPTSSKVKVLANMSGFDNGVLQSLRKLSSIRNAFAHNNIYMDLKDGEFKNIFDVMNSSGIIKKKEYLGLFMEYKDEMNKVIPYLNSFLKNQKLSLKSSTKRWEIQ